MPTAKVARGPVETKIHALGELRPAQTASIVAPPMSGGTLQIIYLVKTGTRVKQGDVVVQFDPSEQEYNLEQSQSQLEEADQQIIKLKADQAVKAAQNRVTLMKAQYSVRRAELKVQGNDLLGAIEAKKNLIDLEDAKRRYEQLQRDIKSRASSDAADMAVQNVARMRAQMGMKTRPAEHRQLDVESARRTASLSWVKILNRSCPPAAASGLRARRTFRNSGKGTRCIRAGWSRRYRTPAIWKYHPKCSRRIGEISNRGSRSRSGWIRLRSKPTPAGSNRWLLPRLLLLLPSTTTDLLESLSTRSFDTVFQVNGKGDQLYMGVSARVLIKGKSMPDALSIPRQALFQRDGKQVVYVRRGEEWESREVRVRYFTESRAVVDGLSENTVVALVDPDLQKSKAAAQKGSLASILGGSAK